MATNLKEYLSNSKFSDLKFLVHGSKEEADSALDQASQDKVQMIYAHRVILGCCSDVFRAMLSSDMKEGLSSCISFDSDSGATSYHSLSAALSYMYSNECDISPTNASELLLISNMYGLEGLKRKCEWTISTLVTAENVRDLIEFSKNANSEQLFRYCSWYLTYCKSAKITRLLSNPDSNSGESSKQTERQSRAILKSLRTNIRESRLPDECNLM